MRVVADVLPADHMVRLGAAEVAVGHLDIPDQYVRAVQRQFNPLVGPVQRLGLLCPTALCDVAEDENDAGDAPVVVEDRGAAIVDGRLTVVPAPRAPCG